MNYEFGIHRYFAVKARVGGLTPGSVEKGSADGGHAHEGLPPDGFTGITAMVAGIKQIGWSPTVVGWAG